MTIAQLLTILKARWKTASLVVLVTVALTLTVSLLLPNQYSAAAAVVVDARSPDPVIGMVLGNGVNAGYLATQVDIITSNRVAQRVVRELKLADNADLRNQWLQATEGKGNFEAWIGERLQAKLDVKPSRESSVITIGYSSPDPRFAAVMANSFAKAYIDTSIELRVDPAKQYSGFFEARSADLRKALEQAQGKLSDYQRKHGLLVTDERLDTENQRLNELTSQLVAIQAISAESTSRSAQARSSADQLQDVINNPVIAGLRSDLSRQEARLQELSARMGDAHPQVQELKANIGSLRQRIDTETRRVSGSVGINNTINKSREAEVRIALEQQRAKVASMKEQRDEASVLLRDVDAAQKAYDTVAQRLTQSSLESQASQTNISILTAAVEPTRKSSPKVALNTVVSLFLGILLAVGITILREMLDRRVRSNDDVIQVLGLPVIGVLPKPIRGSNAQRNPLLLPSHVMSRLPSPSA